MRRALRALSTVLIVAGALLLADAALTLLWQEPVSAVYGRIQHEGEVVHLVAHRVRDLSAALASVGNRHEPFSEAGGRGDEARLAGGNDPRERPPRAARARDIYLPDLHIDTLKVKARYFR